MHRSAAERYEARLAKVLAYIDAHLEEELLLERLSDVASFSKYHFHRQFSELFGIGIAKYVQLCRLKRAAYLLAFRRQSTVMEIALASGYEGPESFARAFRKSIGQSPSAFRKAPHWKLWHTIYHPLRELRSRYMERAAPGKQVRIIDFPATRVAVLEHRGDPQLIGISISKFIAWRKRHRLSPKVSATYNLVYDDPVEVVAEEYRFDLCAATDMAIDANEFGVIAKLIPAGRCAVLRHVGSDDTLRDVVRFLYAQWLPQSGEQLRDFPLFFQRVTFFPDVSEHEAATDIFLPLSSR